MFLLNSPSNDVNVSINDTTVNTYVNSNPHIFPTRVEMNTGLKIFLKV